MLIKIFKLFHFLICIVPLPTLEINVTFEDETLWMQNTTVFET